MSTEKTLPVGGRLHSIFKTSHGNILAGANEILDDNYDGSGKTQSEINAIVHEAIGEGGNVDQKIEDAKEEIIGTASASANTLGELETIINSEIIRAKGAESTLDGKIDDTKDEIIGTASASANTLGELETIINSEVSRAKGAESTLDGKIDDAKDDIATINQIVVDAAVNVSVTASPGVVFVGKERTISVTGTSNADTNSILIKRGETTVVSGSGKSASGNDTITPPASGVTASYNGTFVINGKTKNSSASVTAVHQIYYGAGAVYTDINTTRSDAVTNPKGTYTVTTLGGDYIFFIVPSNMEIKSATFVVGGLGLALADPVNVTKTDGGVENVGYKVYRSASTQKPGTNDIILNKD